jgi:hypothetical protein
VAETDGFGYFSLPGFTGDATLPEILVKMVNADVPPWNSEWVFFSGLTDLAYAVTVTDTTTGIFRSYLNDPGNPYCGGADISAFPAAQGAGSAVAARTPALRTSDGGLSLMSGRFLLTLSATDPRTGRTISGAAIVRDDRFGYFSLPDLTGDASLPEIFVKMLDARSIGGGYWLFQTSLTNLSYVLTLTDSATGAVRTYDSTAPFCGSDDLSIPVEDATSRFRLSGTVSSWEGYPLEGATVKITSGPLQGQTAHTSSHGSYRFNGLPSGSLSVLATANGFVNEGVTVSIEGDTTLDIVLESP